MAVKTVAAAVSADPKANAQKQLATLLAGEVFVDGSKGPRLSYRAWDGQLRQPIMVGHGDGVVGMAPLDGVLHPTEVMDTLGTDQRESQCKTRP
jgi:ABC transporter substrate binding protein (PQQ-dependent alcohol dehydrogenase system)